MSNAWVPTDTGDSKQRVALRLRTSRPLTATAVVLVSLLSAGPMHAKPCPPRKVYGLIGQRYSELHGSDAPLGCPLTDEADVRGGGGRFNNFEHGVIVWSPSTGPGSVQSAYVRQAASRSTIVVDWGDTSPFNYDKFLVRWDLNGVNVGQQDVGGPRTSGHFEIPVLRSGTYRIVVEGCDHRPFGSSVCRQGWSKPMVVAATVDLVPPPTAACATQTISSVTPSGSGSGAIFDVQGCGFRANAQLRVRLASDQLQERDFNPRADGNGRLSFKAPAACASGAAIHVSATDGTVDSHDLTGFAWSNTFNTRCP